MFRREWFARRRIRRDAVPAYIGASERFADAERERERFAHGDSVVECEPELGSEREPEPGCVGQPQCDSEREPGSVGQPECDPEFGSEREPDTRSHAEPESDPDGEPDGEPDTGAHAFAHGETDTDTESHGEPDTESHGEPDADAESHGEPDADAESDTESHGEPDTESNADSHSRYVNREPEIVVDHDGRIECDDVDGDGDELLRRAHRDRYVQRDRVRLARCGDGAFTSLHRYRHNGRHVFDHDR
jgi:hypothetical protein